MIENLYHGVNAHLHSALQSAGGGWTSFHHAFITYLTEAIAQVLPLGYYVVNERSLQLLELAPDGSQNPRSTVAHVAIYGMSEHARQQKTVFADAQALVVPAVETLSDEDYARALVVYQQIEGGLRPVTRIEVMSPSNKPPGTHAPHYLAHRDETLLAGINLVEIDLLHERRSPIKRVLSYPKREEHSAPYVILVTDPHPTIHEGQTAILYFRVDDPLPNVRLPLADDAGVVVSLGKVYNRTFTSNPYFGMYLVDYDQFPARFETYAQEDQDRIRSVMSRAKVHVAKNSG